MKSKLFVMFVFGLAALLPAQSRSGRHWQPGAGHQQLDRLVDAAAKRSESRPVDAASTKVVAPKKAPEPRRNPGVEPRSGRHWR